MRFKEAEPVKSEKLFYTVSTDDTFIDKLFTVYEDSSFLEKDFAVIRVDNVLENNLKIDINASEMSLTINQSLGILFHDEFSMEVFLDELFFTMETINNVPEKSRTVSSERVIKDLPKYLNFIQKGENDGKLDDIKDIEKQNN